MSQEDAEPIAPVAPPTRPHLLRRSAAALSRGITQTTRKVLTEAQDLPERRAALLSTASDAQAADVPTLTDLSDAQRTLVSGKVRAAYWSVNSQSSWFDAFTQFLESNSVLAPVVFLPVAFCSLLPLLIYQAAVKHFLDVEQFDIIVGLTAAVVLAMPEALSQLLSEMDSKRLVRWVRTTHLAMLIGLLVWRDWMVRADTLVRDFLIRNAKSHQRPFDPSVLHIDTALTYALALDVAVVLLLMLIPVMLSAARRIGPAEPAAAVSSGRMILELYQLALIAQRVRETWSADSTAGSGTAHGPDSATSPDSAEPADHTETAEPTDPAEPAEPAASTEPTEPTEQANEAGLQLYISGEERRRLLTHLERLSRLARGSWRRSLRAGDAAADYALAGLAEGISVAATRWKTKVAVADRDELASVSQAFTSALLDACEGNWHGLAAEVTAKELLGRRLIAWARRLLATTLMFLAVVVITVQPDGWPVPTDNPVLGSLILAGAGALCLYIDPNLGERLGKAGSLMNPFSEKK